MEGRKMKTQIKVKHAILLSVMILFAGLFQSCVVYRPYSFTPVTIPDIVQMSKDKVPSQNIINEIKKSHTAYALKADEYAKLQQAGVADSVVNYMQQTHINMIRNNQQAQDSYYGYSGYWYGGLGYGWPLSYWGWNMGPNIVFRGGGGGFHGGGGRGRR
jgi:hypothetical protein